MVNKLITDMNLTGNGLRDWLVQRFTAIIIGIYFILLSVYFLCHPNLDYVSFKYFFTSTWMKIFTLLTLFSLLLHAWVGIWTVITDYIKSIIIRLTLQAIMIVALLIYFFWGITILGLR